MEATDKLARCSVCGAENRPDNKFCGDCGRKFVAVAPPVQVGTEEGLYYCARHKKETTRVTCGRCEKPICPKCMVMGSAGVRCKECAQNRVPIRARGVLHDASKSVTSSPGAKRVWYMVAFAFILNAISSVFGGFGRHDS